MHPTIEWKNDRVVMIDQRRLPGDEVYIECADYEAVARAIETMVIRGAPAIGVAAAYGVALGIRNLGSGQEAFDRVYRRLERTRPTAVNLFWALDRMKALFERDKGLTPADLADSLLREAQGIEREDLETNQSLGDWGEALISDGERILTHCNAGGLATAGYGTALGVVRSAVAAGKAVRVYADETRPFLQGARLTCWELQRENIPVVLITDNMAGHLMQRGEISLVITGADRIAGNGDTANKIGTYTVAVLAREHGIPFYIAAPRSTIDFNILRGSQIPIEERDASEVRECGGRCVTVPNVEVRNPAFDVTPAEFVTAIITEKGIVRPPYDVNLLKIME